MKEQRAKDETDRFLKFKELVSPRLTSVGVHDWCMRHGIEIVLGPAELSPLEVFCIGVRVSGGLDWSRWPEAQSKHIADFVRNIGDRIAVTENEDFSYLFPRDLYDKILLFGVLPD